MLQSIEARSGRLKGFLMSGMTQEQWWLHVTAGPAVRGLQHVPSSQRAHDEVALTIHLQPITNLILLCLIGATPQAQSKDPWPG